MATKGKSNASSASASSAEVDEDKFSALATKFKKQQAVLLMEKEKRSKEEDAELQQLLKDLMIVPREISATPAAEPAPKLDLIVKWNKFVTAAVGKTPLRAGTEQVEVIGALPSLFTSIALIDRVVEAAAQQGIPERVTLESLLTTIPADDGLHTWVNTPEAKKACSDKETFVAEILGFLGTSQEGLQELLDQLWAAGALWSPDGKHMLMTPRAFVLYMRNVWETRKRFGHVLGEDNAVLTTRERLGEAWRRTLRERIQLQRRFGNDKTWEILTFAELLQVVHEESQRHPEQLVLLAQQVPVPAVALPAAPKKKEEYKPYERPAACPMEEQKALPNGRMSKIPEWLYRLLSQPCGCKEKGHETTTLSYCQQKFIFELTSKIPSLYRKGSSRRRTVEKSTPKPVVTPDDTVEGLVMPLQCSTVRYLMGAAGGTSADKCILDSGAFAHITNDVRPLRNIRDLVTPLTITGLGQQLVTRKGDHPIWGSMYILTSLPLTILSLGQFLMSDAHDVDFLKPDYLVHHPGGSALFRFDPKSCLWWQTDPTPVAAHTPRNPVSTNRYSVLTMREDEEFGVDDAMPDVAGHILASVPLDDLQLDKWNNGKGVPLFSIWDDDDSTAGSSTHTAAKQDKVQLRHHSLGHPGVDVMKSLAANGYLDGITEEEVRAWAQSPCHACVQGRSKAPAAVSKLSRTHKPNATVGSSLHMDIFFVHAAKNVKTPMVVLTDEATGWVRVRRMASQTTAELARHVFEAVFFLRAYGHEPRTISSDREANLERLQHLLVEIGVDMNYMPEGRKDARAEVKIGILRAMVRSTLQGSIVPIPQRYAAALIEDVGEAYNLLPNTTIGLSDGIAPYDLIHKRNDRRYIINARVNVPFGAPVLAHLPSSQYAKKAEGWRHNSSLPHSEYGFVIGRKNNTPHTVLAYCPRRMAAYQTSQVRLIADRHLIEPTTLQLWTQMYREDCPPGMPYPLTHAPLAAPRLSTAEKSYFAPAVHQTPSVLPAVLIKSEENATSLRKPNKAGQAVPRPLFYARDKQPAYHVLKDPLSAVRTRMSTNVPDVRSKEAQRLHSKLLGHLLMSAERINIKDARKHHQSELAEAALTEARKLIEHKALRPVMPADVPKTAVRGRGMQVVERKLGVLSVRCVFDKKRKDDVSRDFYAPTARSASTMMIANIAEAEKLDMRVLDVKRAFLNSPLPADNPYYIEMRGEMAAALIKAAPEIFEKFYDARADLLICHLQKALYGLEEASLAWYKELTATMKKMHFKVHPFDSAIFFKRVGTNLTVAGTHVDDILIAGKVADLDQVQEHLDQTYGVKKQLGPDFTYLGLQFQRQDGILVVHQGDYEADTLASLPASYSIANESTPTISSAEFWTSSDKACPLSAAEKEIFSSILHKIMFLASRTRPELTLATSFLAKRKDQATEQDKAKLCKVLGYLHATKGHNIHIAPQNLQLACFTDASFAPYPYEERRISQIGYTLAIGHSWVMSKSTRTKITCDSATAAEIYALHEALREVLWARYFLQELGFKQRPIPIYEDNDGVVKLVRLNSGWAGKSKHLEIRFFKAKDMVDAKIIQVIHVSSGQQLADHLTKPLSREVFQRQVQCLRCARLSP